MIDNWTKEFFAFCEAISEDMESFFNDVEQWTEEFPNSLDEAVQQMEETIDEEIEIFWQEVFEPLILAIDDIEEEEGNYSDFAVTTKVNPDQNTHPACQGCRHYHGYVYGGNLFVCGMHPYGWPDENCPDWEPKDSSNQ